MDELLNEVAEHLQYLGYAIEDRRPGEGFRAAHERRFDIVFKVFHDGLLLTTYFRTQAPPPLLFELSNHLHQQAVVSRFHLARDGYFVMEAWRAGSYDRAGFATFMEAWQSDARTLASSPMATELLE